MLAYSNGMISTWCHRTIMPLCFALSACTSAAPLRIDSSPRAFTHLSDTARALHVLERLTFGPRAGDVDRVLQIGVDKWIDEQLQPPPTLDSRAAAALSRCPFWTEPVDAAVGKMSGTVTYSSGNRTVRITSIGLRLISRDSAKRIGPQSALYDESIQFVACRFARLEASEQQLLEVMGDFWHNHFSIYGPTVRNRGLILEWDRTVIRPNALGRFRDLLGAVAHSPVMLAYLDNDVSSASEQQPTLIEYARKRHGGPPPIPRGPSGLNENFARELLELHTLGVDGGYTQRDVVEVARAFTGWTHSGWRLGCRQGRPISAQLQFEMTCRQPPEHDPVFVFDSTMHDAGSKSVLGHSLKAGRGLEDGEQVLDIIARHPATARFIARKLATRLVSDTPPEALVQRAAATFQRSDGDIREVVRTIVTSPEFNSANVIGAKIKSPLELVLSTRRALDAPVDTAGESVDAMIGLGQQPYGHLTPEGWPETASGWMNPGALLKRMDFAVRVSRSEYASIPVETSKLWQSLVDRPFDEQVAGVVAAILEGQASMELRAALLAARPTAYDPGSADSRQYALRRLIALTLGSAAFQQR
jgi:uncharacterized protein (DUF1800 family)